MLYVGADYKIMAVSENYWGKGDTVPEALSAMKKASGKLSLPKSYLLYLVHPSAWITQFGDIEWSVAEGGDSPNRKPILFRMVRDGVDINPSKEGQEKQ